MMHLVPYILLAMLAIFVAVLAITFTYHRGWLAGWKEYERCRRELDERIKSMNSLHNKKKASE